MSNELIMAGELMAKLEKDPEFQKRRALRDAKIRCLELEDARLLAPVLASLAEQGIVAETLEEIVQRYAPLPKQAVEIILAALPEMPDDRAQEGFVRALGAAREPFDGRPLKSCYERTYDEGLRWAIINTIALANPHSIDDWLVAMQGTYFDETLRKLRGARGKRKKEEQR